MADDATTTEGGAPAATESAPAVPEGGQIVAPAAGAETPDWNTRITEWGGEDNVKAAVSLAEGLKTPEGISNLFVETGRALGLSFDQLETLFAAEEAKGKGEEQDPNAPVTFEQLQSLLEKEVKGPQREQLEVAMQANARVVIDTEVERLKLDADEVSTVLEMGSKYLNDGDYDPAAIRSAVNKGYQDYEKLIQTKAEKYLKTKESDRDKSVKPLAGGGTGGGEALAPPKDMEEAKARVRAKLRAAGEM